jgi:hypothetical protein
MAGIRYKTNPIKDDYRIGAKVGVTNSCIML